MLQAHGRRLRPHAHAGFAFVLQDGVPAGNSHRCKRVAASNTCRFRCGFSGNATPSESHCYRLRAKSCRSLAARISVCFSHNSENLILLLAKSRRIASGDLCRLELEER